MCLWCPAAQVALSHSLCSTVHNLSSACVLQGTFSDLSALLEEALQRPSEGVADGILLDLGMSSMQAGTLWTSPCRSAVPPDNFLQPGVEERGMPSPKLQHPWHCFRRACHHSVYSAQYLHCVLCSLTQPGANSSMRGICLCEKGVSAAHKQMMSSPHQCDVRMAGQHDKQGFSFDGSPLGQRHVA